MALFGVLPMEIENTGYIEAGKGPKVILIHSSVAGAKQWRNLMETLAGDFHVIAINLFGYGKTRAWESSSPQSLENQARLIEPFLPTDGGEISIVGHSFGGCVAMKAAALFKTRVRRLVLIEPNPFYLLAQHGHTEAYQEVLTLQDAIKLNGKAGTWESRDMGNRSQVFCGLLDRCRKLGCHARRPKIQVCAGTETEFS